MAEDPTKLTLEPLNAVCSRCGAIAGEPCRGVPDAPEAIRPRPAPGTFHLARCAAARTVRVEPSRGAALAEAVDAVLEQWIGIPTLARWLFEDNGIDTAPLDALARAAGREVPQ